MIIYIVVMFDMTTSEKQKQYYKKYREEHKKECNQHSKKYRETNKEKIKLHRETLKEKYKLKRFNLKKEVMEHYCGGEIHCQCPSGNCKVNDIEFMTIDHIKGDGAEHRKEIRLGKGIKGAGGSPMYNWLKKNNYPEGFRVLCYNCNCSLGNIGYCPHNK
jgi:hypothetical protein